MDTGTGRHITQKVAKEFFMDVVGMSPQSAYMAASIIVSAGVTVTMSIASASARALYNKLVPYEPTWAKGGAAVAKDRYTLPVRGANNVGTAGPLNPNGLLNEGGITSRLANQIPGINATAGIHDIFQIDLNRLGGTSLGWALNVPGMPPAAALTYFALLRPQVSVIYRDEPNGGAQDD